MNNTNNTLKFSMDQSARCAPAYIDRVNLYTDLVDSNGVFTVSGVDGILNVLQSASEELNSHRRHRKKAFHQDLRSLTKALSSFVQMHQGMLPIYVYSFDASEENEIDTKAYAALRHAYDNNLVWLSEMCKSDSSDMGDSHVLIIHENVDVENRQYVEDTIDQLTSRPGSGGMQLKNIVRARVLSDQDEAYPASMETDVYLAKKVKTFAPIWFVRNSQLVAREDLPASIPADLKARVLDTLYEVACICAYGEASEEDSDGCDDSTAREFFAQHGRDAKAAFAKIKDIACDHEVAKAFSAKFRMPSSSGEDDYGGYDQQEGGKRGNNNGGRNKGNNNGGRKKGNDNNSSEKKKNGNNNNNNNNKGGKESHPFCTCVTKREGSKEHLTQLQGLYDWIYDIMSVVDMAKYKTLMAKKEHLLCLKVEHATDLYTIESVMKVLKEVYLPAISKIANESLNKLVSEGHTQWFTDSDLRPVSASNEAELKSLLLQRKLKYDGFLLNGLLRVVNSHIRTELNKDITTNNGYQVKSYDKYNNSFVSLFYHVPRNTFVAQYVSDSGRIVFVSFKIGMGHVLDMKIEYALPSAEPGQLVTLIPYTSDVDRQYLAVANAAERQMVYN